MVHIYPAVSLKGNQYIYTFIHRYKCCSNTRISNEIVNYSLHYKNILKLYFVLNMKVKTI